MVWYNSAVTGTHILIIYHCSTLYWKQQLLLITLHMEALDRTQDAHPLHTHCKEDIKCKIAEYCFKNEDFFSLFPFLRGLPGGKEISHCELHRKPLHLHLLHICATNI